MPACSLSGASMCRTTDFVTPCSVRSPVTRYSSPDFATDLLAKVIVGNFATSKKSGLFRCPSRCATPVSTVVVSIVAFTLDFERSFSSKVITPLIFENRPRTFDRPMWRTANSACECAGSSFQVDCAEANDGARDTVAASKAPAKRCESFASFIIFSFSCTKGSGSDLRAQQLSVKQQMLDISERSQAFFKGNSRRPAQIFNRT